MAAKWAHKDSSKLKRGLLWRGGVHHIQKECASEKWWGMEENGEWPYGGAVWEGVMVQNTGMCRSASARGSTLLWWSVHWCGEERHWTWKMCYLSVRLVCNRGHLCSVCFPPWALLHFFTISFNDQFCTTKRQPWTNISRDSDLFLPVWKLTKHLCSFCLIFAYLEVSLWSSVAGTTRQGYAAVPSVPAYSTRVYVGCGE